jgi:serine/threonine protein kinase
MYNLGPLVRAQARNVIVSGVAFIHGSGYIYRDLKPKIDISRNNPSENNVVCVHNTIKTMNFLARLYEFGRAQDTVTMYKTHFGNKKPYPGSRTPRDGIRNDSPCFPVCQGGTEERCAQFAE